MTTNYHTDLLDAISDFEARWSINEDDATRHLSVWVESYTTGHPDFTRVRWSMLALRLFLENRHLYTDALERIAQMVLACTVCRTRLEIPSWQLPMLQGELTYAIWQREGVAPNL